MTSIHPLAYIIVGTVVSGYSKFVQYKNSTAFLEPFFWIGLLFIVIGLFKFGFRRFNRDNAQKQAGFDRQYKQINQEFRQQHNQNRPFNTYDPDRDKQKPF